MQSISPLESGIQRVFLGVGYLIGLCMVLTACLASGQGVNGSVEEGQGKASYYADKFEGRTTANGETYDPTALTAAHPHLPFGTHVRVIRVDTDSNPSVEVRINDRGPFKAGRIIDLSKAAAQKLGMIEEGIVEVRLELVGESNEEGEDSGGGETGWR